jgi:hypothetical protein
VQKTLVGANIKLAGVAKDIVSVWVRETGKRLTRVLLCDPRQFGLHVER